MKKYSNENEWDEAFDGVPDEKALVQSCFSGGAHGEEAKRVSRTLLIFWGGVLCVVLTVIALIFFLSSATPKSVQRVDPPTNSEFDEEWRGAFSARDIYEDCYASTVSIRLGRDVSGMYWSGFVIDGDGWIVTSLDVMDTSKRGRLYVSFCDGREYSVESIQKDDDSRLALLKISATELGAVSVRDESMQSGEGIIAMGAFEYGNACVLSGEVSGALDDMLKINIGLDMHGTGAPLFDEDGYLVGIATAKNLEENSRISYAISAQKIKTVILAMKNGK